MLDIKNYKNRIEKAARQNLGHFGNNILYKMCENYPGHKEESVIIGKIWLIGRAYAASVERRRNKEKNEVSDNFYIKKVMPAIRASNIDKWLSALDSGKGINEQNILKILQTHNNLLKTLFDLTGQNKRSLSSKYLHFHKPNLFFIYDNRASGTLGKFVDRVPKENANGVDKTYSIFVRKCLNLQDKIRDELRVNLTPRQLDNFIIDIANNGI